MRIWSAESQKVLVEMSTCQVTDPDVLGSLVQAKT